MVVYPNCKVNLGLYVTERRADGMHNLSTIFLPIPLCDTLEIVALNDTYSADIFHLTGTKLPGGEGNDNLVMRTILSLREDYQFPFVEVWLHKRIPTGAGLGGGSSDAAYAMRAINEMFDLHLSDEEANRRLSSLGADCAFFWHATPAYAEGIGEKLESTSIPALKGLYMALVKPAVGVSTREAFGGIVPQQPAHDLRQAVKQDIHEWKSLISNDFEKTIFPLHPEIAAVKQTLYDMGAVYAQMSGSGSSVLAIFRHNQGEQLKDIFSDCFTFCCEM